MIPNLTQPYLGSREFTNDVDFDLKFQHGGMEDSDGQEVFVAITPNILCLTTTTDNNSFKLSGKKCIENHTFEKLECFLGPQGSCLLEKVKNCVCYRRYLARKAELTRTIGMTLLLHALKYAVLVSTN